jgi:hypothetical protein
MKDRTGREHTMKRIVVILGVAAAMVAAPSVASAGTSATPQKKARIPAFELSLQSTHDDRSGQTIYRLGNSGLWMQ